MKLSIQKMYYHTVVVAAAQLAVDIQLLKIQYYTRRHIMLPRVHMQHLLKGQ